MMYVIYIYVTYIIYSMYLKSGFHLIIKDGGSTKLTATIYIFFGSRCNSHSFDTTTILYTHLSKKQYCIHILLYFYPISTHFYFLFLCSYHISISYFFFLHISLFLLPFSTILKGVKWK